MRVYQVAVFLSFFFFLFLVFTLFYTCFLLSNNMILRALGSLYMSDPVSKQCNESFVQTSEHTPQAAVVVRAQIHVTFYLVTPVVILSVEGGRWTTRCTTQTCRTEHSFR